MTTRILRHAHQHPPDPYGGQVPIVTPSNQVKAAPARSYGIPHLANADRPSAFQTVQRPRPVRPGANRLRAAASPGTGTEHESGHDSHRQPPPRSILKNRYPQRQYDHYSEAGHGAAPFNTLPYADGYAAAHPPGWGGNDLGNYSNSSNGSDSFSDSCEGNNHNGSWDSRSPTPEGGYQYSDYHRRSSSLSYSDTEDEQQNVHRLRVTRPRRRRPCCPAVVAACNGFQKSIRDKWLQCTTGCQRRLKRWDRQHYSSLVIAALAILAAFYFSNLGGLRTKIDALLPDLPENSTKFSWKGRPDRRPDRRPTTGTGGYTDHIDELGDSVQMLEEMERLKQQLDEGTLLEAQLEKMKEQLRKDLEANIRQQPYQAKTNVNLDEHQRQLLRLQESVDALSRAVSSGLDNSKIREQLSQQADKLSQLESNLDNKFATIQHKISNFGPGATPSPRPDVQDDTVRLLEERIHELDQHFRDLRETHDRFEQDAKMQRPSPRDTGYEDQNNTRAEPAVDPHLIEKIVEQKLSDRYPNPHRQVDWISSVTDHSPEHLEGNAADRISGWLVGTGKRPEVVLQNAQKLKIGECYPLRVDKTTAGWMEFKMLQPIVPRQVTLHHVEHTATPLYTTSPEQFWVLGSNNKRNWHKLGMFTYKGKSSPKQTFTLNNSRDRTFEFVRLEIKTNRGAKYTCLYQFSVHGELPKRIEFMESSENQPSL